MNADPDLPGALDAQFGLAGTLAFRAGPGGLCLADVRNAHAAATVCLQGAQVLHWQPHAQAVAVLWLSETARYAPGNAIRGGIPVCWPWFGAAPAGAPPGAPAHGFARTRPWRLTDTAALADGRTQLVLALAEDAQTLASWPHPFALELAITVGATLGLRLTTRNTGAAPLVISEALHSYFRVGDIGAVGVHGLEQAAYFDAVLGQEQPAAPGGAIRFDGEIDRVYDSVADCRIDDPSIGRRIHIAKSASSSTVVWNPWRAKAERLGDLGPAQPPLAGPAGGWRQMVCVESGNARGRAVPIGPGQTHTLGVHYTVADHDTRGASAAAANLSRNK